MDEDSKTGFDAENDDFTAHEEDPEAEKEADGRSWGDRMLVEGRELSPRHRKLAELLAQGLPNHKIAEQLGYTDSRVSILKSNTKIREETERIRERIFEESVGQRLKKMTEPALAEIERCLGDKTKRYSEKLKQETARWLLEKVDGKAAQKHELGDNLLAVMMDKLDAVKSSGYFTHGQSIDVTPQPQLPGATPEQEAEMTEEEKLAAWVKSF